MDDGVTALEYAIIAGLIALAIVGGVRTLGVSVTGLFEQVVASFP